MEKLNKIQALADDIENIYNTMSEEEREEISVIFSVLSKEDTKKSDKGQKWGVSIAILGNPVLVVANLKGMMKSETFQDRFGEIFGKMVVKEVSNDNLN